MCVSIPLWFLRNRERLLGGGFMSEAQFPYHYGSYATRLGSFRVFQDHIVSIPLWFLRNKIMAVSQPKEAT